MSWTELCCSCVVSIRCSVSQRWLPQFHPGSSRPAEYCVGNGRWNKHLTASIRLGGAVPSHNHKKRETIGDSVELHAEGNPAGREHPALLFRKFLLLFPLLQQQQQQQLLFLLFFRAPLLPPVVASSSWPPAASRPTEPGPCMEKKAPAERPPVRGPGSPGPSSSKGRYTHVPTSIQSTPCKPRRSGSRSVRQRQ